MDIRQYLSASSATPKQILKIVLSFAVVMLVMWLFMISRMDHNGVKNTSDPVKQERTENLRSVLNHDQQIVAGSEDRSSNIFMNAFTTFLVLLTLLGLVWFWSRKKSGLELKKDQFREMGSHMLGQGAQLKVIEINNEIWVFGINSNNVNLLHRYPKDEWSEPVDYADSDEQSFYQMLKGKMQ